MTVAEIRKAFLDFFKARQHEWVASSSLIPAQDPSLLFTNAGMVQFKDVFLGLEQRSYDKAVSSQACIRAGGKHNDLENVGYTARHHTFFEMLGNFSFGSYFKREAIHYAWEFLTLVLKIPASALWVTVYEQDQEAEQIWLEDIGIDKARYSRCGEADNFWSMGDTGPCGPCSEIYFDHGSGIAGGPPGSNTAGERYVEIWNLVFMQYNRDSQGRLNPLPRPSVDTGMGLERIAAVMQGVHSNYEIDVFQRLTQAIKDLCGGPLAKTEHGQAQALNVLTDHLRSTVFLIAEGVVPSNEGQGYVLRRIMRRALRHGQQLGFELPFFHRLVPALVQEMSDYYPLLSRQEAQVVEVIKSEEEQFNRTLSQGLKVFSQALRSTEPMKKQDHSGEALSVFPADWVFKLYDTYGFPADLTAEMAREQGLVLDWQGFEVLMEEQRARARKASQFCVDTHQMTDLAGELAGLPATEFLGHETLVFHPCRVIKILPSFEGRSGVKIILDKTPFYPESGGQRSDVGHLHGLPLNTPLIKVLQVYKVGALFIHEAEILTGSLEVGDLLEAEVHAGTRLPTMRNHSATHLMHAALRSVLGQHVIQKGSCVSDQRLRFDFTHPKPVTSIELQEVMRLVNEQIWLNEPVEVQYLGLEEAKKRGAIALFGEKYEEQVRTLSMGKQGSDAFSIELCGGTHVGRTGDIGLFHITHETGIAAGIRRIEAITGERAYQHLMQSMGTYQMAQEEIGASADGFLEKLKQLKQAHRETLQILEAMRLQDQRQSFLKILQENVLVLDRPSGAVHVLVQNLTFDTALSVEDLKRLVQLFKGQFNVAGIVVLGALVADKAHLMVAVTSDLTQHFSAQTLIQEMAPHIAGKGGGKADFAQAGGPLVAGLETALEAVLLFIQRTL